MITSFADQITLGPEIRNPNARINLMHEIYPYQLSAWTKEDSKKFEENCHSFVVKVGNELSFIELWKKRLDDFINKG